MKRTVLILAATLLVAGNALGAQGVTNRGAFVMRIGTDTIVIERFDHVGDTLQGSISVKGQPRQEYVAVMGPGLTVNTLSLNVFTNDIDGAAPAQRVLVSMRGDSVFATIRGTVQRFGTIKGAIPLLNNSFALAELFTERARSAGRSADVPAWAMSGGTTLTIAVRPLGADSVTLAVGGVTERLRVDGSGRILGGTIPSQRLEISRVDGSTAATLKMGRVDYSPPAGAPYTATEVTLTGQGGIVLGGTLTVPKGAAGRVPAVVTITGSGQQDRDEYIPLAGGYRPFRQVADTLGRRGIAVLRLDDRMIGMSGGQVGTSADYADDVRAALAFLRTRPEIDPNRPGVARPQRRWDDRANGRRHRFAPQVESCSSPVLHTTDLTSSPTSNGMRSTVIRRSGQPDATLQRASRRSHLIRSRTPASGSDSSFTTIRSRRHAR